MRPLARGETGQLSPDIAGTVVSPAATAAQQVRSTREFKVLRGLVEGQTVDQIGERLHLSGKTVCSYQTQIHAWL